MNNPIRAFLVLLAAALVVLRLCRVITWSWWWVTLPLWGGLALAVLVALAAALIVQLTKPR
jgi:hypothetical protein